MSVELINVIAFVMAASSLFFVICDGPNIIFGISNFNIKKFSIILFSVYFIVIVSQPIITTSIKKIQEYQSNNLKEKEAFERTRRIEENNNYQKNQSNSTLNENQNSFEGTSENKYETGNDGRVYETDACSLCNGTGLEKGRNMATGEAESRICPMCDGKGVRSY
jgi:hypothetical protein